MGPYIDDNKLVITRAKTFNFHFHLAGNVDKNLRHEIDFIIKQNGFLAEQKIKSEIDQLLYKCKQVNEFNEYRELYKIMNHINLFLACHKE